MICTESRHVAGFRCVQDQIFPLFDSIFRLCRTSLLNHVSEQKMLRVLRCVPLIASTQQKKVSITRRLISFTLIPRLALIVVCVLMNVQCKQFFQKMICLLSGTSTSKSMQTGSKRKKFKKFFPPQKLTQNHSQNTSGCVVRTPPRNAPQNPWLNRLLGFRRSLVDTACGIWFFNPILALVTQIQL